MCRWILLTAVCLLSSTASRSAVAADAKTITYHGYKDCIVLRNENTRVVLCPIGGRVLEYAWKGQNSLYLAKEDRGDGPVRARPTMSAGRFDIGPEQVIPRHPRLWSGRWLGKVTGPRSARLTSVKDAATGVQLVRDFRLDADNSRLVCTQTIRNVSDKVANWCHWSRTFATGNGICLIPLSPTSRFPLHYVMYHPESLINFRPRDKNIRQRDGFLEILATPRYPKLGMDSRVGWLAYLGRNDLLFVKRFRVHPQRVYNEVAGLTISVWYPEDRRVELEPIGPAERLAPGAEASFSEHWWLLEHAYPKEGQTVDLVKLRRRVQAETRTSD